MKSALVLSLALLAAPAFADQGTPVCEAPTTFVVCEIPGFDSYNAAAVSGATKADALRGLNAYYLLELVKRKLAITCTSIAP